MSLKIAKTQIFPKFKLWNIDYEGEFFNDFFSQKNIKIVAFKFTIQNYFQIEEKKTWKINPDFHSNINKKGDIFIETGEYPKFILQ